MPDYLHVELVIEILSRLCAKSLSRCKCVCRAWHELIESPDFIRLQLCKSPPRNSGGGSVVLLKAPYLYSIDFHSANLRATRLPCLINNGVIHQNESYPRIELAGSCNGLVCVKLLDKGFALYNPVTGSYKELPKLQDVEAPITFIHGDFGYDCVGDDYKIIRHCESFTELHDKIAEEFHLYSLKTDSWKRIPAPNNFPLHRPESVVHNNSLHLRTCDDSLCFDLFTQEFDEIPLPLNSGMYAKLAVLRGHLHLINNCLTIWIMEEYGETKHWVKLFHPTNAETINDIWSMLSLPLAYSEDGSKILIGVGDSLDNFICCDIESQKRWEVKILNLPKPLSRLGVLPWVPSLVPLV